MKPGFYISMGIAIAGLIVGFVFLNDIQQEKESKNIWIQKIPTQCHDVWEREHQEFYDLNPELLNSNKEKSKEILETIIKNHYEKAGISILDLNLELDVIDEIRCESCDCLGSDRVSIKIPKNQFELISQSEGWKPLE